MSERYIPFGAYESRGRAWSLLRLAEYQVRPGNIQEALMYFKAGLLLLPLEFFDDEAAAKAEIVSICLSCAKGLRLRTARDDAIALVEGTLAIVGENPELQAALAELREQRPRSSTV